MLFAGLNRILRHGLRHASKLGAVMETAGQYVRTQAIEAAKVRLKHASKIVELHASKILFKKTVKLPDCPPFLVRLEFPGVVRVFDSLTGDLLAESMPGKLDQLNPEFCPPLAK